MARPGGPEFQLRSRRGAARSRPWAKKPISDQTGSLLPKQSRNRTAAPASRFTACPSVVRCGAGRTSNSRSTSTAWSTPRRYSHCACGSRAARNHRRTVDSGRPKRAAMVRYPAPRALWTRALPSRLCCRPAAPSARSAAGSGWPSSHGSGPPVPQGLLDQSELSRHVRDRPRLINHFPDSCFLELPGNNSHVCSTPILHSGHPNSTWGPVRDKWGTSICATPSWWWRRSSGHHCRPGRRRGQIFSTPTSELW